MIANCFLKPSRKLSALGFDPAVARERGDQLKEPEESHF